MFSFIFVFFFFFTLLHTSQRHMAFTYKQVTITSIYFRMQHFNMLFLVY